MLRNKINLAQVRTDFRIFKTGNGKPFVYLDSAATSLTPQSVTDSEREYYEQYNANIHRGLYKISEFATQKYEHAHEKISQFVGCDADEVIFVRNATEALNLVMYSYGMQHVSAEDNVVISIMEHHSNLVPWQQLCKKKGAELRIVDVDKHGVLDFEDLKSKIDEKSKIIAISHMSNVFGTVTDIRKINRIKKNAVLVVDAAQSVAHMPVNFVDLGCDFLAFSGHKMCGPTGIGVLVGRKELLRAMPPFLYGGDMIKQVSTTGTTWNDLPWKFEAGTPNIAGGIGLGAAVDYLSEIGMDVIEAHEKELGAYALERLGTIGDVRVIGGKERRGTISFVVENVHAHDVATLLDSVGICVRAGHHCCEPLMEKLGVSATVRMSFYFYNTMEDVDALIAGLKQINNTVLNKQSVGTFQDVVVDQMYREHILDHFKNPRNHGRVNGQHIHDTNPLCGDKIDLYVLVVDKAVVDIGFVGDGCAISQASSSILTEYVKGKSVDDIKRLQKEDMERLLGIQVSMARVKCMMLAVTALKKLLWGKNETEKNYV